MNDEMALRMFNDFAGNHLWNPSDNSILGKSIVISYDMPFVKVGAKP